MAVGRYCLTIRNRVYHCVFCIPDWNADNNRLFGNRFSSGIGGSACNGGCFSSIIKKNTERIWCKIQLARIDTDNGEEYVYGKFIGSRNFAFSSGSCCGLYYKSEKERHKMYRVSVGRLLL